MASLRAVLRSETTNATVGWVLTALVVVLAGWHVLGNDLVWAGLAFTLAGIAAVPAAVTRRWTVMVPWPLLALAAAATAVGGRAPETAYLAVAAAALLVVVELDAFSDVRMSRRFAVVFTVLTTWAFQALWTVAQFYSDRLFGTDYLTTQTELQWDIVTATVVGLVLGVVLAWYFERVDHVGSDSEPSIGAGSS